MKKKIVNFLYTKIYNTIKIIFKKRQNKRALNLMIPTNYSKRNQDKRDNEKAK